jgi:glycine cleavage system H protein
MMVALFVIGLILVFLVMEIVRFAVRGSEPQAAPARPWSPLAPSPGIFASRGHTWVRLREDGYLGVGVDSFARQALGPADHWKLPKAGTEVRAGEPLLEAVKGDRRLSFRSPASGTVVAARPQATATSSGDWMLTIRPKDVGEDIRNLLVGEESRNWFQREVDRFREFLSGGLALAPATLPDGGQPVEGALAHVDDESWADFERKFLADDE